MSTHHPDLSHWQLSPRTAVLQLYTDTRTPYLPGQVNSNYKVQVKSISHYLRELQEDITSAREGDRPALCPSKERDGPIGL